jgi:hypothetical protein
MDSTIDTYLRSLRFCPESPLENWRHPSRGRQYYKRKSRVQALDVGLRRHRLSAEAVMAFEGLVVEGLVCEEQPRRRLPGPLLALCRRLLFPDIPIDT